MSAHGRTYTPMAHLRPDGTVPGMPSSRPSDPGSSPMNAEPLISMQDVFHHPYADAALRGIPTGPPELPVAVAV